MTSFHVFKLRRTGFAMLTAVAIAAVSVVGSPAVAATDGSALYRGNCAMCHGPTGAGRPGSYPVLAGRVGKIAATADGRTYLSSVLITGLHGPIVAGGQAFKGYMPPFRTLSDDDIAALLSYIATLPPGDGAEKDPATVSGADVAKARAAAPTVTGVMSQRQSLEAAKKIP